MQYLIVAIDQPDSAALRSQHLQALLDHIETIMQSLALAGPCPPTNATDDRQYNASVLLFNADDQTQAEALFKSDPYYKAGVWESFQIYRFLAVAGGLVGGKTW